MKIKSSKTKAIPLESIVGDEGFDRNHDLLEDGKHEDPALRKAIRQMLRGLARKGIKFLPGRSEGSISKETKYIRDLTRNHCSLSAKELFAIADKSIIGNMQLRTFENHVSAARKKYEKERTPAK